MAQLSAWQRWWMGAWPHRWQVRWAVPRFLRSCPTPFRGEVLEVGAGRGWTSRRVLETFPQVELTAVDVDPHVKEIFQKLTTRYGHRLHVVQADARALPFDRARFDFVLAINVVRHLEESERQKVMVELLRVLRPGGMVGMSESGASAADWETVKRRLSEEDCEVVFASTKRGFDVWAKKNYPAYAPFSGVES